MDGLYALKPWYTQRLRVFMHRAEIHGTSPDVFTAIGVFGAAAAAVSIAVGWWPLAVLWLGVRLAGANLDGAVARSRKVCRPWGFALNEIGDRASDLLMFSGLAVWAAYQGGPGMNWLSWPAIWVLFAALAATLPTFASLAAAAAGATRRNDGPFGKTERCLAAIVAAAAPAAIPTVCASIVVGSLLTAALRLAGAHRELTQPET
ncbi:CDP-alcohol phosphatidyltransferase family protein [Mycolicibacterium tusciae]|uniref:CDP-alcohol phosphatidyltransferase family protein n=1 Tax=Mycolicibacterium tusciae TaxID=75922 RepID=UPI00024A1A0E|nr:CDP-alcohol phosphatidyltransferase family protein [Mycolicibacterium tusciae]